MDRETIRPDKTKWYKTRMCWCDDCRFFSEEERPVCPRKNDPHVVGIQLWASHPDMIGCKDYIDPLDFLPPPSYMDQAVEERSTDNNFTPDS